MKSHLTIKHLSERWSIPPKTLERWRLEGKGPTYLKLGHHVRYPVVEIERYEQKRLRGAAAGAEDGAPMHQANYTPDIGALSLRSA